MYINTGRIIALLAEAEMTQAALAEQSGLSRQSVNTILRRGSCAPQSAWKIAKGLGVSFEDLIMRGD